MARWARRSILRGGALVGRVWFGCSLGVDTCTACARCPCRPHWVPCGRPLAPPSGHARAQPMRSCRLAGGPGAYGHARRAFWGLAGGIDCKGPFALAPPSDGGRPLVKAIPQRRAGRLARLKGKGAGDRIHFVMLQNAKAWARARGPRAATELLVDLILGFTRCLGPRAWLPRSFTAACSMPPRACSTPVACLHVHGHRIICLERGCGGRRRRETTCSLGGQHRQASCQNCLRPVRAWSGQPLRRTARAAVPLGLRGHDLGVPMTPSLHSGSRCPRTEFADAREPSAPGAAAARAATRAMLAPGQQGGEGRCMHCGPPR
jgi:hypothetical protein